MVIINVSVVWFYEYIGDISIDIFTQNINWPKINLYNKTLINKIKNIIGILKLFCWKYIYIYNVHWLLNYIKYYSIIN